MTKPNLSQPNSEEDENAVIKRAIKKGIWIVIGIFFLIILLISLFGSFYTVGAGERGVILTFGKPNLVAQDEGLHFKVPIMQSVVLMDVKTQKYETKASSASKDLQTVSTDVALNYYINPESVPEIYQKIGVNYQDKVIAPAIQEVVKASTALYTAEELITKRQEVKEKIEMAIRERLDIFNIKVQTTSITNFDFSSSFNSAIEAKVVQEQASITAKNKLEQIKYEAEQNIAKAEGEARAIKVQIDAIRQNGGEQYIQLKYLEKWDGHLSQVSMGNNAVPLLNIPINTPQ